MPASPDGGAAPGAATEQAAVQSVVEEVLAACRISAAAGASALWRFAGERFRRSLGDSHHLERVLANELYSPLLTATDHVFDPLDLIENAARQRVTVSGGTSGRATFLFALALRSDGGGRRSWSISGLERELEP